MILSSVGTAYLDTVKRHVLPMLEEALSFSGEKVDRLWSALQHGKAQLTVGVDESYTLKAVCVTEIFDEDGLKILNVWAVAGSPLNEIEEEFENLEAWAREQGIRAIVITEGRKGWVRLFGNNGYRQVGNTLRKDLNHG